MSFLAESQGVTLPPLRIADVPAHPVLPQTTWRGRTLTLDLLILFLSFLGGEDPA